MDAEAQADFDGLRDAVAVTLFELQEDADALRSLMEHYMKPGVDSGPLVLGLMTLATGALMRYHKGDLEAAISDMKETAVILGTLTPEEQEEMME